MNLKKTNEPKKDVGYGGTIGYSEKKKLSIISKVIIFL